MAGEAKTDELTSRLLTPRQLSERLGGRSLYSLAEDRRLGRGPRFIRGVGGRSNAVWYDEQDVEDWLEEQKVKSIAEERARGRRLNGAAETGGFRRKGGGP